MNVYELAEPLGRSGQRHSCALYLSDYDVFSGPSCNRGVRGGLTLPLRCHFRAPTEADGKLAIPIARYLLKTEMVEPDGIEPTT